ncbi:MAG: UvrB/UvrC motif-containing protein [Spirochaetales bacterium]|nr:UvrB/UvrC motif-containing protein [Spirochaetales bacterium]
MNCEICHKNKAIIHIHQVSGNKKTIYHICENCARDMGFASINDKSDYSINNLFKGLFKLNKTNITRTTSLICHRCSWTMEKFRRTKHLGCPECYNVFYDEIKNFFVKKLKIKSHMGKLPRNLKNYKKLFIDVVQLKGELRKAVKKEEYEKAASLRDEIDRLKGLTWREQ